MPYVLQVYAQSVSRRYSRLEIQQQSPSPAVSHTFASHQAGWVNYNLCRIVHPLKPVRTKPLFFAVIVRSFFLRRGEFPRPRAFRACQCGWRRQPLVDGETLRHR